MEDQPVTPAGRLFLSPEIDQIIHGVIGGDQPIDIDRCKADLASSLLLRHPRFNSLLVVDPKTGKKYWRPTSIDIDKHLIIVPNQVCGGGDNAVNDYLSDLAVSSPLDTSKPLWEIHVLMAHTCAVFRVHHALGDGISLVKLLLTCCRREDDPTAYPLMISKDADLKDQEKYNELRAMRKKSHTVWGIVKLLWLTLLFIFKFLGRALWVKDRKTALSGGKGIELWPRKIATATFLIQDMKLVKKIIPGCTVNDVLFGVISCGLSRYLEDVHSSSSKALKNGTTLTGVAFANLRRQPGVQELTELVEGKTGKQWGNRFGMLILPVTYHKSGSNPLDYVKRAKAMIDWKKRSLEPQLSYSIGRLVMKLFGTKFASLLNYRIVCNTTFTITNVVGPKEEITMVGNKVTYMRVSSSSLPHSLTMHMLSYAGKAEMQIMVAKDLIPEPQVLAKCFEDALLEMKTLAQLAAADATNGTCAIKIASH
uniref:Diacylglycerol O-acyltransferase n=1 Tax=Kalanchoe fedtschenkoi TaxID=63787 RepID=A0A7N0T3A3_KALFE